MRPHPQETHATGKILKPGNLLPWSSHRYMKHILKKNGASGFYVKRAFAWAKKPTRPMLDESFTMVFS
jgi:hypothetical protein